MDTLAEGTYHITTNYETNQVHRVRYWIDWFLGLDGNSYFCKVDDTFIMDRFNLTKLDEDIPHYYSEALNMLTDNFGKCVGTDLLIILLLSLKHR